MGRGTLRAKTAISKAQSSAWYEKQLAKPDQAPRFHGDRARFAREGMIRRQALREMRRAGVPANQARGMLKGKMRSIEARKALRTARARAEASQRADASLSSSARRNADWMAERTGGRLSPRGRLERRRAANRQRMEASRRAAGVQPRQPRAAEPGRPATRARREYRLERNQPRTVVDLPTPGKPGRIRTVQRQRDGSIKTLRSEGYYGMNPVTGKPITDSSIRMDQQREERRRRRRSRD
jgi:hypothetical protein